MGAQARHIDPHSGESVCCQGQECATIHTLAQVGLLVQAGVLPLSVDGKAVHRKAGLVQRSGSCLDVGRPRRELPGPLADVPRWQGSPESGGQLGEHLRVQGPQPVEAQPHSFEECEGP